MITAFIEGNLSEKEWLIDCLYSLKPDHHVFKNLEENLPRSMPIE